MREIIQRSLASSLESYQKVDNINIMLADIFAHYIALCAIYEDRRGCESALNEVLRSSDMGALHKALHKEGFPAIASRVHKFLVAGSFDASQAKNLFESNEEAERSYKSMLKKIIFTTKKSQHPKSKHLRSFMHVLSALEKSYAIQTKGLPVVNHGLPDTSVDYSKDDMQCLLNLISSMITRYMAEYQNVKDRFSYNDRVQSFGKRLADIVTKNDMLNGKNDYKILLAIIHEFNRYDFTLDDKFKATLVEYNGDFAIINNFLSQKRLKTLLFDLDMKINNPQLNAMPVSQSLQIILAIKSSLGLAARGDDFEEITLIDQDDVSVDISRQVDLFIKCFNKVKPKSSQEIVKDILSQGLSFMRSIAQQAFIACRYFLVAIDISLISLSLVAGVNVFIANSLLILALSAIALFAFIAADCYKGLCNINKISANIYESCVDLHARTFSLTSKEKEFVIDLEGHISFDSSLIIDDKGERSNHSGIVIDVGSEYSGNISLHSSEVVALTASSKVVN